MHTDLLKYFINLLRRNQTSIDVSGLSQINQAASLPIDYDVDRQSGRWDRGGKRGPEAKCKHLCLFKAINCEGFPHSTPPPSMLQVIFAGLWPFYPPSVSFLPSKQAVFLLYRSIPVHSFMPSAPLCLFHYRTISFLCVTEIRRINCS